MSFLDECNLLRKLYEQKYYQQSSIRDKFKQSQQLTNILTNYKQKRQKIYESIYSTKQSAPMLANNSKKIYDFKYCNVPIKNNIPMSYRDFSLNKDRRKARSVCNRLNSQQSGKEQSKNLQAKSSILHSKESHYLSLLSQRKRKNKSHKIIAKQLDYDHQRTLDQHRKTSVGFVRSAAGQARKRATISVIRNKIFNKTHQVKKDENDVLPWNAQIQEFI